MHRRRIQEGFVIVFCLGAAAIACQPRREVMTRNPYASAALDCRSAATLLRRGAEPTPHMAPPLWRVRACPESAGRLLAALLDTSRQVADTAELEHRTWLTQYVHDVRIVETALGVAADATAGPTARVAAIRTLIWMKSPGMYLSMTMMFGTPDCIPPLCRSTYEGHYYRPHVQQDTTSGWPVFGRATIPGYTARVDSVLREVSAAPATPGVVRAAAQLALRYPMAERLQLLLERSQLNSIVRPRPGHPAMP